MRGGGRGRLAWTAFVADKDRSPPPSKVVTQQPCHARDNRPGIALSRQHALSPVPVPAVQMADILVRPQPRQNRSDAWRSRPSVIEYRACRDALRGAGLRMPHGRYIAVFFFPMPKSWSEPKKKGFRGRPHQSKPDLSNAIKTLEDALTANDERLFDARGVKLWADAPRVVIIDAEQRPAPDDAEITSWLPPVP
jgi:Holliday junction resolvase RusA-like endonuclease